MKDKTKNKLCGIAGTVLFHLLLFLMLLYFTFPRPEIPDEASGVLVQLGTIDEASGTFQPEMSGQNVADAMEAEIPDEAAEESITQDIEESVAVPDKKKEEKQQPEPEKKTQPKPEVDNRIKNQVANAFSKGNAGSNRGTSDKGSGAEGSPNGNSTAGAKHGSPGYGDYDLGGRGLKGGLPIPQYDASNDEGTIVVSIYVNAQGKVTQAAATPSGSRGTAYANLTLRARAEAAARKAVFERKPGAVTERGTITYYFRQN
ncbi:MAG: energy transducer TonB [Tannerella sp.]|uniref:energy transducer TonB n=1 Tax=uncultured Coprobacter sp. TaxID=1720550 RepID=UPI00260A23D7|nr:energy transducer TonB [uncultured Coprobacter sp.]MBS6268283.1 energy transducer TonB [Tannerella sp.]